MLRFARSRFSPKIIGSNTHLSPRPVAESKMVFNELVGHDTAGTHAETNGKRLGGHSVLRLIDIAAAGCAAKHVFGANLKRGGHSSSSSSSTAENKEQERVATSVTTVSFLEIVFRDSISTGDFMNLTSSIVDVGSSSCGVHVSVDKLRFPSIPGERSVAHLADAFASFVAIGDDLRPVKSVPPLLIPDDDTKTLEMHERSKFLMSQNRLRVKEEEAISKMNRAECEEETKKIMEETKGLFDSARRCGGIVPPKAVTIPMSSTTLTANRLFMRQNLNLHSTVFGGELLNWMASHAEHTAARFCCDRNIGLLAMHSMNFHSPVMHNDWTKLTARVVSCRNSTVEVDVELEVDRADGTHATTNCASFVYVLFESNSSSKPRQIAVGLDMLKSSEEECQANLMARARYLRLAKERMKQIGRL